MKKKFVIVEHDSDKFTFEAILKHINANNTEVNSAELWYEPRSADNDLDKPTGLKESIISAFKEIKKGKCDKIAVIWDLDTLGVDYRVTQCENAFNLAVDEYTTIHSTDTIISKDTIEQVGIFYNLKFDEQDIQIGCYFVNYKGEGEIEDLLKAIKVQGSPIADCVDKLLPECLKINDEKELREKDLVKLWINHYQRYDTLKKKDRNEANTKTENVMLYRTDLYDFDNETVEEFKALKTFLKAI
jgi:hypothetical protein